MRLMISNKKGCLFFYLMIIIGSVFIVSSNFKIDLGNKYAKSFECKDNFQYQTSALIIGENFFIKEGISQNISLFEMRNESFTNQDTQNGDLIIYNAKNDWNMTEFKLNFTDIYATEENVKFEIRNDGSESYIGINQFFATSFKIPNTCFLRNISIFLQYWGSTGAADESEFSIRIYNTTISSNALVPDSPIDDSLDKTLFNLTGELVNQPARWYQSNFTNRILNISKTINNTFFAVFRSLKYPTFVGSTPDSYMYFANEKLDDKYDILFYKKSGSFGVWNSLEGKNGMFKAILAPISESPNANQINLTVFNTQINASGFYENTTFIQHDDNKFLITVSSHWFGNVEYNATFVGNFKFNTHAETKFKAEFQKDVNWNSTRAINEFSSESYNKIARFYRPTFWKYNQAYNNTIIHNNIDIYSNYIEVIDATNHKWTIMYNQTNSVINKTIQSSDDQINWKDIQNFAKFTDYINVTAKFNNSNGQALMYVRTTRLDITTQENLTGNTHYFPIWSPELNTSTLENNTLIRIQIMSFNGTMAGIDLYSFRIILEKTEVIISISGLNSYYFWEDTLITTISLTTGGTPLIYETFLIKITEVFPNGDITVSYNNKTTNNEGKAYLNYHVGEIDKFSFEVIFEGTIYFSSAECIRNIDVRSPLEHIFLVILPFIPLIMGITIGISSYAIIKRVKNQKRRALWQEKTNRLLDVLKIEYILIIHKLSGIGIVQKEFGKTLYDSQLISGFLQAISTFKREIIPSEVTEGVEESVLLDYQDYKIILKNGELIKVALVLNLEPSKNLNDLHQEFIEQFEIKYDKYLKDFSGEISQFDGSIEIIDKIFRTTLLKQHIVNKSPPHIKLSFFQRNVISIAEILESDKTTFYISTMLNYLISAMPKVSKEQIIASIYDLREYGFLIPLSEV